MRDLPTFDHRELVPIIQRGYGLRVDSIETHRRVYRVETNLGIRFFKPFHLSEARLQLIVKGKEHLRNRGFHQLTMFIPTVEGKLYYKQGRQLFYMTDWIEGHPSNYDSPFELKLGVQLFAQFHRAARGFDQPEEMHSYLGKWPDLFADRLQELRECQSRARQRRPLMPIDAAFLREAEFYIGEVEKAINLLEESIYRDLCKVAARELPFCHHDPAHHNILVTPENEPFLIDFDYLLQDIHLHDLASIIIRNGKASGWHLKRCAYLLRAYNEALPVSRDEMAVLRAFMTFPHDIWLWARARYIEEKPWPLSYYYKEWERKTRDEEAHQQFLRHFSELEI